MRIGGGVEKEREGWKLELELEFSVFANESWVVVWWVEEMSMCASHVMYTYCNPDFNVRC